MVLVVGHQLAAVSMANSEGWLQAAELGLALVLSAAIGLEREMRQKSAGLRTYTLVGVGAKAGNGHPQAGRENRPRWT